MRLSVVVPVYNEVESIRPLTEAVCVSLAAFHGGWELVFVDDGSMDGTAKVISDLAAADPRVRLVALARNSGQTAAMVTGFQHARGSIVVTMDGDLQNDPADIPALVAKLDEGYDLVTGWRERRQDRLLTRKVPSWLANRIIARITGIPIKDNGCSLKAYRKTLLERVALYAEMHRFIPAFAALAGARIAQLPVRHHARRYGASKYGLGRTYRVLADLITLQLLSRFRDRPLIGFAWLAAATFTLALTFGVAWVVALTEFRVEKAAAMVLPGAAFVWLSTGVFLLMLGLVAEAIVRENGGQHGLPLVSEFHD